jgi:hypothetical protein
MLSKKLALLAQKLSLGYQGLYIEQAAPHGLSSVSANERTCTVRQGQQTSDNFHRPMLHRHKKPLHQ